MVRHDQELMAQLYDLYLGNDNNKLDVSSKRGWLSGLAYIQLEVS